ncbi:hypothetical protein AB5I41_12925 [Sphingomonas sp. MMS24-JH45]
MLTQSIGGVLTPTTGIPNYGILSKNYALFGEANLNFTERFRAIAGYRSVWTTSTLDHVRTSTNDPTNSAPRRSISRACAPITMPAAAPTGAATAIAWGSSTS